MGKMMSDVRVHCLHRRSSSSSSSIDSSSSVADDHGDEYSISSSTNIINNSYTKDHLSTDLRLGLTLSLHSSSSSSSPRNWPPIKGHLRNTHSEKSQSNSKARTRARENTLFVKVYMEGIPIGRKLDLLSLDGYHTLISTLSQMFKTNILYPDFVHHNYSEKCHHILTYEDKDGDWMMVGDVPWEMFLSTVKRLKIATMDTCQ